MVECVADDGILLREQRLEDTAVGVEAGCIKDSIFRVEVLGDGLFKLLVDVLRATDEAYARHSEAPIIHHLLRCLDKAWVVAQAEIVVGTEVQDFLSPYLNGCPLRAFDETFLLVEAGLAYLSKRLAEMFLHFSVHDL